MTFSHQHVLIPLDLRIRRDHIFEDSYHQIKGRTLEEMAGKLKIEFIGERGIDAGGLTKEWFTELAKEMFNPSYNLFGLTLNGSTYQPSPTSSIEPDHLRFFKFMGRIVAKVRNCLGLLLT